MLKTKTASLEKHFAYKDDKGNVIELGSTLYLGINDDGSRYFEVEDKQEVIPENIEKQEE